MTREDLRKSAWVCVLNDNETFTWLDGCWIAPSTPQQVQDADMDDDAIQDLPHKFPLQDVLTWAIDNGGFDHLLDEEPGT